MLQDDNRKSKGDLQVSHCARKSLDVDVRSIPKSVWMAAAEEAQKIPKDGIRKAVAYRLRFILRKFGVQTGPLVVQVEKSERLHSSTIKRTLLRTLRKGRKMNKKKT